MGLGKMGLRDALFVFSVTILCIRPTWVVAKWEKKYFCINYLSYCEASKSEGIPCHNFLLFLICGMDGKS